MNKHIYKHHNKTLLLYHLVFPSGKSFEQRERDLAWAIFSHNLWVLARIPEADELLKAG